MLLEKLTHIFDEHNSHFKHFEAQIKWGQKKQKTWAEKATLTHGFMVNATCSEQ